VFFIINTKSRRRRAFVLGVLFSSSFFLWTFLFHGGGSFFFRREKREERRERKFFLERFRVLGFKQLLLYFFVFASVCHYYIIPTLPSGEISLDEEGLLSFANTRRAVEHQRSSLTRKRTVYHPFARAKRSFSRDREEKTSLSS
jgi:hypothetical protein